MPNHDARPLLLVGGALSKSGALPPDHPNAIDRQAVFFAQAQREGLLEQVRLGRVREATHGELLRFHDESHVNWVKLRSRAGTGMLDDGDTPAYAGIYEETAARVGTALDAMAQIVAGDARRSFQPAGGLHHGRRHRAAGFCAFNDIGVVIESLRALHGVRRIAYVDIDAHHGDGVFYSYEDDPDLVFADIHEDGRFLFPGTGAAEETGKGAAAGTKLNLPLPPGADDGAFFEAWQRVERHLVAQRPQFFLFQCGADSLGGDPLADLRLTAAAHAHAAKRLCALADEFAQGRLMVFGGGGYHAGNVAAAWIAVLRELL